MTVLNKPANDFGKHLDQLLKNFGEGLKKAVDETLSQTRQELEDSKFALDSARNVALPAVLALSEILEGRDQVTAGHSRRIARMAVHFAHYLKWPPAQVQLMNMVALLHDIGKVIVPDCILMKQGKFTTEEMETMKFHSATGCRIIQRLGFFGPEGESWVLHHHERFDGDGYPDGISGTDIPIGARILALMDTYDAMTESRRYRQKLSHWMAIDEMMKCGGRQFDPDLTNAFFDAFKEPLDTSS